MKAISLSFALNMPHTAGTGIDQRVTDCPTWYGDARISF